MAVLSSTASTGDSVLNRTRMKNRGAPPKSEPTAYAARRGSRRPEPGADEVAGHAAESEDAGDDAERARRMQLLAYPDRQQDRAHALVEEVHHADHDDDAEQQPVQADEPQPFGQARP